MCRFCASGVAVVVVLCSDVVRYRAAVDLLTAVYLNCGNFVVGWACVSVNQVSCYRCWTRAIDRYCFCVLFFPKDVLFRACIDVR